jgi:iron(III) transport system substrate-binding protein
MVRIFRVAGGLTYNTEKVKPEDLPNTWDELLDPKWAGKVIVDPRGRPLNQLSLVWGEDKVLSFTRQTSRRAPSCWSPTPRTRRTRSPA